MEAKQGGALSEHAVTEGHHLRAVDVEFQDQGAQLYRQGPGGLRTLRNELDSDGATSFLWVSAAQ